ILPFAAWVPIGKSNHVLDLQKRQKNPIFQIVVDILQNTNFFRAFTSSASVPAIYIQQLWNTLTYVEKARTYRFQLDKDWFTLDANLLREALEITPIDQAHPFVSPPSGDAIMDFVNELGYPEVIHFVSSMVVNHLYQPWRAILSMINQCLTSKTSRHDRPRYPVLQMLWGIITNTNVDYAELMWEEFVQAMQTFLTDKANLGTSLFHLAEEDLRLSNLKFVSKGKNDEVFGMPIPNELISNNIRNASYYNAYLKMVAKHDQKVAAEKEGKKKFASTKQPKRKPAIEKSSKPALASKPKVTKEKPSKASTAKPPKPKPAKEKSTKATPLQKAGKEPAHSKPVPKPEQEGAGEEYDMERAIQMGLELFQAQGHAYVGGARSDKTSSGGDTEIVQITKELGEDVEKQENVEEKTVELDQDHAGSDPDETLESRPQPKQENSVWKLKWSPWLLFQYIKRHPLFLHCSQCTTESELAERVTALEKKLFDLEHNNKNLDNTTRNLGSRVYTLELRDLPHKINEAVRENVKEAVQIALQAPLRDRFRDLSEEDMKEMLHQRMFETGSYKSLPEHIALYEALEASMERAQRDEFLAEKDRSRKRCRDDQDPPPPPDSDLSKRRRHDTGAFGSSQPQSPQLSAWKKSGTRDAPSSSSKQQSGPHVEQPVKDIPIPDSANISDLEDTDSAHLLKIKQRPEWLKPIPDDERPATPEPAWVIPTSHIPDVENNLANALASTYQAPVENYLLEKTGDMQTFMNWYCQKIGKTELTQGDLEGQAYEVVKPFYPDVVHLQFQMEECHKMLIDQIDWANPEGDQVRIDISKPLPLSGPPGHVIIQTQFFFNKDLDYLRYGSKGSGQALSISKMKAACYHDFGLELLILEHMWIDDVYTYDISASYGISYWWFNCQKFFIDRHTAELNRKVVRTHMCILSVVGIKGYSCYGDFEDLNLLLLQGHLNHLPGSNICMISTAVKLWTRNLDATGFEFKHDYTIIDSPRAVVFPVSNNERKIMRFNEIYKSDTYRVVCFETFRLREQTSRSSQDLEVQVKMEMEIPCSSGVYFITACSYSTDTSNDLMKAQLVAAYVWVLARCGVVVDDDGGEVRDRVRGSGGNGGVEWVVVMERARGGTWFDGSDRSGVDQYLMLNFGWRRRDGVSCVPAAGRLAGNAGCGHAARMEGWGEGPFDILMYLCIYPLISRYLCIRNNISFTGRCKTQPGTFPFLRTEENDAKISKVPSLVTASRVPGQIVSADGISMIHQRLKQSPNGREPTTCDRREIFWACLCYYLNSIEEIETVIGVEALILTLPSGSGCFRYTVDASKKGLAVVDAT
ncbi:hypothetical protein Tco_1243668, partial [Tanacetum coccineum]